MSTTSHPNGDDDINAEETRGATFAPSPATPTMDHLAVRTQAAPAPQTALVEDMAFTTPALAADSAPRGDPTTAQGEGEEADMAALTTPYPGQEDGHGDIHGDEMAAMSFRQTTYYTCITHRVSTHCGWHHPILEAGGSRLGGGGWGWAARAAAAAGVIGAGLGLAWA